MLHLTYKELQATLKEFKANGADVKVKLNSKQSLLQAEVERLTANDSVEAVVVEKELPNDEDFSMVNMTVIRRKAKELGIGYATDTDKELYTRVTEYTRHASDTHEQKLVYVNTQLVFLPYGSVSSTQEPNLNGQCTELTCSLPANTNNVTETPAPKKHTTKSFDETSREAVQKDVEKSAYLGDLCGGSKRGADKIASVQDKKDAARAKRENLAKLELNQAPRHQAKKQEPKKHTAIQESVKKVALTISKTVNPYFVTYESKLTDTEKQAVKNAKELASNVLSFCKGFAAASAARAA